LRLDGIIHLSLFKIKLLAPGLDGASKKWHFI